MASPAALPAYPPPTAPTIAPTAPPMAVPTPGTTEPMAAPAAPAAAAPTPVATGWEPGVPVIGSGFESRPAFLLFTSLLSFFIELSLRDQASTASRSPHVVASNG